MSTLSSSERLRGRRYMSLYQGLNTISFLLLSGNIITLYALRLGASSLFIGLISSIQYLGFFFMLVGRRLVDRYDLKLVMGFGWIARYILMIPFLISPFVAAAGDLKAGLLLIVIALLGFHIARGISVIGFNPMIGVLSEGRDRGAFLARIQIINQVASLAGGLLVATMLGARAHLSRYTILVMSGIVIGIIGSLLIFKLPSPPEARAGLGSGLVVGMKSAFKRATFRRFILVFTAISTAVGMADPFRIVFAKEVYHQSDSLVILFTVVGNLGAIAMGLFSRLLIDRLGAKPLYVLFTSFLAVGIIPMAISPAWSGIGPVIFLSAAFFIFQLGMVGASTAAQNYFFGIIKAGEFLNLGILYNLCSGIGGAIGSLFGGSVLDVLRGSVFPSGAPLFRVYYALIFLAVAALVLFVSRLANVGRYSVRNALNIIFSPRDLRAVALLNRLERSRTMDEEVETIRALGESHSEVPVEDLLQRLKHPRFYVRQQALRALEVLPVDPRVTRALINEVKNHKYTTAYIAARIIGRKGIKQGIRILRDSLDSSDYLLQANAMLALGRLGDVGSVPYIERAMTRTRNPLVLIHAATALDALGSIGSIPLLVELLRLRNAPPFLRDEIILSIAGIIGFGDWFYGHYAKYLERARAGAESLVDYLNEKYNDECGVEKAAITETLEIMFQDGELFSRRSAVHLAKLSSDAFGLGSLVPFIEAAAEPELIRFERFRFLIAGLIVWGACSAERGSAIQPRVD